MLFSSRSDGSIIYINSPLPWVTSVFSQHQVRSRRWLAASITWISHPTGAISSAWFKGMTHSESPSLHPILEELPSEDDSASSEGGAMVPLS
jgi:hypothetical protein